MREKDAFSTRSGLVAEVLINDLMRLELGERLPPIAAIAEEHRVGVGTVQKVLRLLESRGGVELESRGHLGTFLRGIDSEKLWEEVRGYQAVSGVMPLPFSRLYEGLATGITGGWRAKVIRPLLTFRSGAASRLQSLMSKRQDFAVMSRFSAEEAAQEGRDVRVAVDFGPQSYGEEFAVFFSPGRGPVIDTGYRVGVDPSSFDQVALTKAECTGKKVKFVQMGYLQLWEALSSEVIHAAIWDANVQGAPRRIRRGTLTTGEALALVPDVTTAVAVTAESEHATSRLLREAIDVKRVRRVQQDVMEGRRLPSY